MRVPPSRGSHTGEGDTKQRVCRSLFVDPLRSAARVTGATSASRRSIPRGPAPIRWRAPR